MKRVFVAYFYFVGWECVSLGVSLCFNPVNIEIHVPFGFFRICMSDKCRRGVYAVNDEYTDARTFGYDPVPD
jgi:hypothetical protein